MTHQEQAGKRRFKKRHIIWIILLGGLAGWGAFRFYAYHQLEQRIEELWAQGYPMSPVELDTWYKDSCAEDQDDAWPLYLDAFAALAAWDNQAQENLPGYSDQIHYHRGEPWKPFHLQEAQAFLADNEECLELLYEGADIGYSVRPLDFSQGYSMQLPRLSETRECARLLRLDAQMASQQGDIDRAVKSIQAIFALADSLQAPMTIMYFVQRATWQLGYQSLEDLLSLHPLTPDHIQTLEAVTVPIESIERFKESLVGERCMGLSGFKASVQETIMLSSTNSEDRLLVPLIALRKILGLHDRDALSFVNVIQAHIEAASLPRHEVLIQMSAVEKEHQDKLGMLTRILTPAFVRTYQVELQAVATSLCARTALAVERHRLTTGKVPGRLDQLVPTFMPSVPLDPFDGQALRFRDLGRGYVVYSVGQDLTDNQGEERRPRKARRGQKTWDETFTVAR
jgi:hypothetical protein